MQGPALTESGIAQVYAGVPSTVDEKLREVVDGLRRIPGVRGVAVSRRDGLVIHHSFKSAREAAPLCAMAAAVVGFSTALYTQVGHGGSFSQAAIESTEDTLLIAEAGPEAVLACVLSPGGNLGIVRLGMAKAAQRVNEILEEM